jgi:hypothetical protein
VLSKFASLIGLKLGRGWARSWPVAPEPSLVDKICVADWFKTRSWLGQKQRCRQNSWSVTILLDYGLIFALVYVMITTTSRASMTMSHTLFAIVVNFSLIMCRVCKRLVDLLVH